MNKQIFLHIGQPKAASTYLQKQVFPGLNPDQIAYNPDGTIDAIKELEHSIYINEAYSQGQLNRWKSRLHKLIDNVVQDKILISREMMGIHFGDLKRAKLIASALGVIFPGATLIIILREQTSWIRSLYSLNVQYGYVVAFNHFLNYHNGKFQKKMRYGSDWSIDYDALYFDKQRALLAEEFAFVECIRFETLSERPDAFMAQISEILDVDVKLPASIEKVNKSLNLRKLKAINALAKVSLGKRIWNEKFIYLPYHRNYGLLKLIRYAAHRAYHRLIMLSAGLISPFFNESDLFSTGQLEWLAAKYARSNAKFWEENVVHVEG